MSFYSLHEFSLTAFLLDYFALGTFTAAPFDTPYEKFLQEVISAKEANIKANGMEKNVSQKCCCYLTIGDAVARFSFGAAQLLCIFNYSLWFENKKKERRALFGERKKAFAKNLGHKVQTYC